MCGIVGIFADANPDTVRNKVSAALSVLVNRGPDGQDSVTKQLSNGIVVLGHRRLAIIDLTQAGIQPRTSPDGRYSITFNGEIYNYRELRDELARDGVLVQSDTDTEVLLCAWIKWGPAVLQRLIGMYAFAVYDHISNTIDCVRDAFGIKPFYFYSDEKSFAFGSEIRAVRILIPGLNSPDLQRAYDYLVNGRYDDSTATQFARVSQLEAGSWLRVSLKNGVSVESQRWWCPSVAECKSVRFDDAVDLVRTEMLDSVRMHLRSDVPIGAALSGGLDSSTLVCLMRHLEPDMDIRTFSYLANDDTLNERKWVDLINGHVKAISTHINIGATDIFSDIDDLVISNGEPFGSTSVYASYKVYQAVRANGVIVCLDGQGADEIFAGYDGYPHLRVLDMFDNKDYAGALRFIRNWSTWPRRSKLKASAKVGFELLTPVLQNFLSSARTRLSSKRWIRYGALAESGVRLGDSSTYHAKQGELHPGRRLSSFLRQSLSGGPLAPLLRHGDRNSMRWSVESRVPFLNPRLANLALTFPSEYLVSPEGETKSVLRTAMRGIVPDELLNRRDKIGFETPERHWIASGKLNIERMVEAASSTAFLDPASVRATLSQAVNGSDAKSRDVWRLINYCKWTELVLKH